MQRWKLLEEMTSQQLRTGGVANWAREARWLLEHWVRHKVPSSSPCHASLTSSSSWLESAIERRCQGEPLAYILQEKPFHELPVPLRVTPDVLIPRPETEQFVDLIVQHYRRVHEEGEKVPLSALPSPSTEKAKGWHSKLVHLQKEGDHQTPSGLQRSPLFDQEASQKFGTGSGALMKTSTGSGVFTGAQKHPSALIENETGSGAFTIKDDYHHHIDQSAFIDDRMKTSMGNGALMNSSTGSGAFIIKDDSHHQQDHQIDRSAFIDDRMANGALKIEMEKSTIIDVGTGSGAIALALANALPHAPIVATDISAKALAIAQENARRNQLQQRVRFLPAGHLLDPLLAAGFGSGPCFVVANLPYISPLDYQQLDPHVRCFEPALALKTDDPLGLDLITQLLRQAPRVDAQFMWVEHGDSPACVSHLASLPFFSQTFADLAGKPRFSLFTFV